MKEEDQAKQRLILRMRIIPHQQTANDSIDFFSMVKSTFKFRLLLLVKLPAAFFSGLKVGAVSNEMCTVSMPFKWLTQNPFRSTYFACLGMAAEMSTGILAMANCYRKTPAISMLVTAMEAQFYKKATGKTYFTCTDGNAIRRAVEITIDAGEAQMVTVTSVGKNSAGELIAEFKFTWSFKRKTQG